MQVIALKQNILKIVGFGNNRNYFNSINHFNEILAERTGWSKKTVKDITDQMFKSGELKFFNNQIKCISFDDLPEYNRVPEYFLLTKNNKDRFSHLDTQDWEVLTEIQRIIKRIHYIFEYELKEELKENAEEQYFFGIKYLQRSLLQDRKIDLSYNEIRTSIHKLKIYFGEDFHRIPSKQERLKRIGQWKDIFSWSFSLPERKQWKQIIMSKIENFKDSYTKLSLVTPYEKKLLDKANRKGSNLSILEWSKLKASVSQQLLKLQEGAKKWIDLKEQVLDYLNSLIEKGDLIELLNEDPQEEAISYNMDFKLSGLYPS